VNNRVNIFYLTKLHYPQNIDIGEYKDYFDERELARYHRFTAEKPRTNFILGRLMIKSLLAEYLQCHVSDISFIYSKSGKPCLSDSPELHFSISHCSSAIVVAIAKQNIGLDAEDTARAQKLQSAAELYINTEVARKIAISDEMDATEIFNLHWTCLESVVKLKDSTIFKERENFYLKEPDVSRNPSQVCAGILSAWSFKPAPEFRISVISENYFADYRIHEFTNIEQFTILPSVGLT
jgi:4'-phosphopantetheinyl transferase